MKKSAFVAICTPIVLAIATWFLIRSLSIYSIYFERFEFLLSTIISTSATISGFILTAVTILVGATSRAIMKRIREQGGLQELCCRYTESLVLGLIVIVYFTFLGAVVEESGMTIGYISFSAALLVGYLSSITSTCYYLLSIIGKLYYDDDISDSSSEPSSPEGDFRFGSNE